MKKNQGTALDLLTGLVGDIDGLKVTRRKMSGSFDMLGMFAGDFEITTNKKGRMKEIEMSMLYGFEDDRNIQVEVEWEGINQKRFEKALRRGYEDEFFKAIELLSEQDIGGFIDEMESIPGVGDLSVEATGNGQNLSWD